MLPVSPNPTPSWLGIEGSSPRSLMVPSNGSIHAAQRFHRKWKFWWCEWQEKTPVGPTIAFFGALTNLGHHLSDQTVGNILRRHGIAPAPKRSRATSWKDFISAHMDVLTGDDFFTVEVLTWRGLVTYYILFFIHLGSRRVRVAGITRHPDQEWMEQIARSATQETWGYLQPCRYILHDRDTKFCASFRPVLVGSGVKPLPLPARSPNLNAFAERWVRSAKEECLSKFILFGEGPLSRTLAEFNAHYHGERNHQGKLTNFCSQRLPINPNNVDIPLRVAVGSEVY
jgi:hypothetical protein